MTEDTRNGTQLLVQDIKAEMNKRLSPRDKIMLRSLLYMIEEIPITRQNIVTMQGEIITLKKSSIVIQAKEHPKAAVIMALLALAINSMINWQGIRRPILQTGIFYLTGVLVPLDTLP